MAWFSICPGPLFWAYLKFLILNFIKKIVKKSLPILKV